MAQAPPLTLIFHGEIRRQSGGRIGLDSAVFWFRVSSGGYPRKMATQPGRTRRDSRRRISVFGQKMVKVLDTKVDETGRSAEIIKSLPSLEGSDGTKLEYIKEMIQLTQDDVRQVLLYVSGSAAVTVIVISSFLRSISALSTATRIFMCISVAFIVTGSLCFFRYARWLHITRMGMVRCIPSLDAARVRELWAGEAGVWARHGRSYRLGQWLISIGSACLFITLITGLFMKG